MSSPLLLSLDRAALDAGSAVVVALNKADVMSRTEASDALRGLQQQLERMEDGRGIAVVVRRGVACAFCGGP